MSKNIYVLVDNDSWILPFAQGLVDSLRESNHSVYLVRDAENIGDGWINFMLGCTKLLAPEILKKNTHNLVVHESNLPVGRGFAPMSWQILEGKNIVPVCLLEASIDADAGQIWIRDQIRLKGSELCDEWRMLQGKKTIELCQRFISDYKSLEPFSQIGNSSWYERRSSGDSELDVKKTIEEQFNLLRIVDNERYPAFFWMLGKRYTVKITEQ